MTIPSDKKFSAKEFHNPSKYKDRCKIEMKRMWHLDTTILSEIVGTLGMFKKNKYIDSVQGNPFLCVIKKCILMKNAHVLIKIYPICSIASYGNLH